MSRINRRLLLLERALKLFDPLFGLRKQCLGGFDPRFGLRNRQPRRLFVDLENGVAFFDLLAFAD